MDAKILYVNQEVDPYLPDTDMGITGRVVAESLYSQGLDVRNFMPKFGGINERKNQLHEVIRLSGVNIIINDTDHPLLIKVASVQPSRMQVYFIDSDDYFQKRHIFRDKNGQFYPNNDERMIFFSRGVLETVRNLVWQPEIIHCNGFFASLVPYYIKNTAYHDDPLFAETKAVLNLYGQEFDEMLSTEMHKKLKADAGGVKGIRYYKEPNYSNLMLGAIAFSDAVVLCSDNVNREWIDFAKQKRKKIVEYCSLEERIPQIHELYKSLLPKKQK